jgi:hypothetical protein
MLNQGPAIAFRARVYSRWTSRLWQGSTQTVEVHEHPIQPRNLDMQPPVPTPFIHHGLMELEPKVNTISAFLVAMVKPELAAEAAVRYLQLSSYVHTCSRNTPIVHLTKN